MKIVSLALCLSTVMLAAGTTTRKVVDPAAVLNRYVAVTGGAKAYRNCSVEIVDTTVTPEHGESYGVTIFRSRDGKLRTEIDANDASGQMGIFKDTAWVFF